MCLRVIRAISDVLTTTSLTSPPVCSQMLSPRGTLEADLTITKLPSRGASSDANGGEGFLVVATDTAHRHVESLLRHGISSHGEGAAFATVGDVSGAWAQINLQGPRSRALLASLTSVDVSDEAFPFRAARRIDVDCAEVWALLLLLPSAFPVLHSTSLHIRSRQSLPLPTSYAMLPVPVCDSRPASYLDPTSCDSRPTPRRW